VELHRQVPALAADRRTEAHPLRNAGPKALEQHICLRGESEGDIRARSALEVDPNGPLPPRHRLDIEGLGHGKLSVIGAPGALPAAELQELGVARVSYGPFTQRVALRALQDLASDLYGSGVIPTDTPALN